MIIAARDEIRFGEQAFEEWFCSGNRGANL